MSRREDTMRTEAYRTPAASGPLNRRRGLRPKQAHPERARAIDRKSVV